MSDENQREWDWQHYCIVGLLLSVLFGCSSTRRQDEYSVIPVSHEDVHIQFRDCDFTVEEMEQYAEMMHSARVNVNMCLAAAYGIEEDPYISYVKIEPHIFPGSRDRIPKHVEFWVRPRIMRLHPRKVDGYWTMYDWAGELHTVYRLAAFGIDRLYDRDIPGSQDAQACVDVWDVERWGQ